MESFTPSTLPASAHPAETAAAARVAAEKSLAALGYVGVIGIEFFALADGSLIANEMAPRVHNSGYWTEAACVVSAIRATYPRRRWPAAWQPLSAIPTA